jgi:hypothetical protein
MHHQFGMYNEAIARIVKSTPAELRDWRDKAKTGVQRLSDAYEEKNWRQSKAKEIAPIAASTWLLVQLSSKPAASVTAPFDV